jgi:hypothetical protein
MLRYSSVRRLVVVIAATCVAVPAFADPSESELQTRGQALAKDGRYTEAIDAFKAADKVALRASHACLIALAYTRRELWSQAELWLSTCHERVAPGDGLPEWAAELENTLRQRLATQNVAAIEIKVEPQEDAARITVSGFPPDESFAPRMIHLPFGHYVITAKTPGYRDTQTTVEVTDKATRNVTLKLDDGKSANAPAPLPPPRPDHSKTLMLAGGITAGVGLLTFGWMAYEYRSLSDAHDKNNLQSWNDHDGRYRIARASTIGLWAAGGALVVTGLLLRPSKPEAPVVGAAPLPGGAMVSIGWQR